MHQQRQQLTVNVDTTTIVDNEHPLKAPHDEMNPQEAVQLPNCEEAIFRQMHDTRASLTLCLRNMIYFQNISANSSRDTYLVYIHVGESQGARIKGESDR